MKLSLDKYLDGIYTFKRIQPKIKLAIVNREYISTGAEMSHEICKNIFVVPVVDTKKQVVLYQLHKDDKRSKEQIFDDALVNTFEDNVRYKGIGKRIDAIGFEFYQMTGESYFLTSLALNPIFSKKFEGTFGTILSFYSRNSFVLAPINDISNIDVIISVLGMYSYKEYSESTGKRVLPDLVHLKDGTFTTIAEYDDIGDFQLQVPDILKKKET